MAYQSVEFPKPDMHIDLVAYLSSPGAFEQMLRLTPGKIFDANDLMRLFFALHLTASVLLQHVLSTSTNTLSSLLSTSLSGESYK